MDQVQKVLESIESNGSSESFLNIVLGHKLINVTQEELCKKMPGVYYNFVCRATSLTNELYKYNNYFGKHIMHNIGSNLQLRPNIHNTIRKKISEAELQRKPYLKNYHKNYNTRKQIKTIKNSVKNLENQLTGKMPRELNTNNAYLFSNEQIHNRIKNYTTQISVLNNTIKRKVNKPTQYNKVTSVNKNGKNKVSWVKKANGGKC
jgi:hypothetical protein